MLQPTVDHHPLATCGFRNTRKGTSEEKNIHRMRCLNAVMPEGTTAARATTPAEASSVIQNDNTSWSNTSMSAGITCRTVPCAPDKWTCALLRFVAPRFHPAGGRRDAPQHTCPRTTCTRRVQKNFSIHVPRPQDAEEDTWFSFKRCESVHTRMGISSESRDNTGLFAAVVADAARRWRAKIEGRSQVTLLQMLDGLLGVSQTVHPQRASGAPQARRLPRAGHRCQ